MRSLLQKNDYSQEWVEDFYSQAAVWWGRDPQPAGVHQARVETVARLCGPGPWTILDLGTGPGATAAALADAGHRVLAMELSPALAAYARELATVPRRGSLAVLEAEFYTLALAERFEVVCCWEVFGFGTDADQRRLLRRIAGEWLAPGGTVLMDVYNPAGPARDAGKEWRLAPLRCYTPADLLLPLEGTGLCLKAVEIGGEPIDLTASRKALPGDPFARDYNYLVQLVHA